MADIEAGLHSILSNDAGVSALVSARIYPQQLPQKNPTYPAITYRLISDVSTSHFGGISCFAMARVQIDCFAYTRAACYSVYDAVRTALSMYSGTSASVVIRNIWPSGAGIATYIDPEDSTDRGLFRRIRDYHAAYEEAA